MRKFWNGKSKKATKADRKSQKTKIKDKRYHNSNEEEIDSYDEMIEVEEGLKKEAEENLKYLSEMLSGYCWYCSGKCTSYFCYISAIQAL